MTTHKEALTLALDWFVCYQDKSMSRNNAQALAEEVVEAIKEALAQPEQEPVAWPTMPPSKGQSPVLFEDGYAEGWAKCMSMCKAAFANTTPPQRKPWVSLSDEQKIECRNFDSRWDVVDATEAKLRELNEAPQRKPLTDEQRMIEMVDAAMVATRDIVPRITRSQCRLIIEAAHGIKGDA